MDSYWREEAGITDFKWVSHPYCLKEIFNCYCGLSNISGADLLHSHAHDLNNDCTVLLVERHMLYTVNESH